MDIGRWSGYMITSSPSPLIHPSSLLSSIASDSLPYFIRSFWHTVEEESNPLSWNWHLDEICDLLTLARDGKEKRIIITVPPGTMKPVHVDEPVYTDKGFVRLGDIRVGDNVLTHRGRFRKVLGVHDQGEIPTVIVNTFYGRSVRAAPDHPFLTSRGWVKAGDLTIHDYVGHPILNGDGEVVEYSQVVDWNRRLPRYVIFKPLYVGQSESFMYPDPITLVESSLSGHCKCLTVEEDSSFTVDGLIVHNSLTASVFFNAWVWSSNPSSRFFAVSYNPDISTRDNNNVKKIITSPLYQRLFWEPKGVTLSSRAQAVERISTSVNGYRIASSVQGGMTGEHPDFIILDDLLKGQDVYSEAKIQQAINFIDGTVSTRKAKDPTIILIMQRLHQNDPAGHILSKSTSTRRWTQVCFPMRFETVRVDDNDLRIIPDPRDHRTEEGELLWPDKISEEMVHEMEIFLGPLASGQLQQYPIPAGGALFKREYFPIVDEVPVTARRCRGWDIAETDGGGDETWGVLVSYDDATGLLYIEHAVWDQVTLTDNLIKSTAILDGKGVSIREGSGSGKAVTKARSILLAGWDYGVSPETESKVARANPFRAQGQAGNIRMKRGDWNEPYLNRVCSFPFGRYDDPVDATSNAVNELLGNVVDEGIKGYGLTW